MGSIWSLAQQKRKLTWFTCIKIDMAGPTLCQIHVVHWLGFGWISSSHKTSRMLNVPFKKGMK